MYVPAPDGSKIVFEKEVDPIGNHTSIFVIGTDGKNQQRLTLTQAHGSYPAWSPDGAKMVFQSNGDSNFELYIMNIQ